MEPQNTNPVNNTDSAEKPATEPQNAPQGPSNAPAAPKRGLVSRIMTAKPPEEAPQQVEQAGPEEILFSWNSPEFIYTHKPAGWYVILTLVFAGLIGLAFGLSFITHTKNYIAMVLFAVMGVAVAVMGSRKPRVLTYSVTTLGVHVGEKIYKYDQFNAFYEADDYGQLVFEIIPNQRFAPLVSLPTPKENEAEILEALGQTLPKTAPRSNFVERIFKALRF